MRKCKYCGKSKKETKFRKIYRNGAITEELYNVCNSCMSNGRLKREKNKKVQIKVQIDEYFKKQVGR